MVDIIPAIIAKDFLELKRKIRLVEPYVDWIQIDVMDGKFVHFFSFGEPKELESLEKKLKQEIHLMVLNPSKAIDDWLKAGASRVIVHWESLGLNPAEQLKKIIEKTKRFKTQIGVALNPETPWQEIKAFVKNLDLVLLMGVNPGRSGQSFREEILPKIKALREFSANLNIEVDGGVKPENVRKIIEAGANILVVGSAIFEARDVKKAIEELRQR